MGTEYGESTQLIGMAAGGSGQLGHAPDLLWRIIFLPSSACSPGLPIFLGALRNVCTHTTLRMNKEGIFWRTTVGSNYSHELYFSPADFCISYIYKGTDTDYCEISFLTHDLDAILNKTVSSSGSVSAGESTGKAPDRILEMRMCGSDRTCVMVHTYSPNMVDHDVLNLTVPASDLYESGFHAPPETHFNIAGPQPTLYTPLIEPKDFLRCIRSHKNNKHVKVSILHGGSVCVSSEQAGTIKRSVIQSLPYTHANSFFFQPGAKDDEACYSGDVLVAVLKALQHISRAHFQISQRAELHSPLTFAVSLGHLSFGRWYFMPIGEAFAPPPNADENKDEILYSAS